MNTLEPTTAFPIDEELDEKLRDAIDAIPVFAWSMLPNGAVDFKNRRVMDYCGLHVEDLHGSNAYRVIHPEDLESFLSQWHAALASGQPMEREVRLRRADGEYRWWLVRKVPQLDKNGQIIRWYGAGCDIEDRKRAEEALFEQRVLERTRIARELHDTLLQTFQALLMKTHAVSSQLSDHPELQKTLETVLDQAEQAVAEGRDALQGLRSSTVVTNDLARAIEELGAELAAAQDNSSRPVFHVIVEGAPRDLAPVVCENVYRIACEAVRNAFQHARAKKIQTEIQYDQCQLRVQIRDDGKGIDPEILESGGRAGHYGLPGLRERAELLQGNLMVSSRPGSGTQIELTIPASAVYQTVPTGG